MNKKNRILTFSEKQSTQKEDEEKIRKKIEEKKKN